MQAWSPLLTGSSAEQARTTLSLIEAHIVAEGNAHGYDCAQHCEAAMALSHIGLAQRRTTLIDQAANHLRDAVSAIGSLSHYGLHGGLCGLGFTIQHLCRFPDTFDGIACVSTSTSQAEFDNPLMAQIDDLIIRELREDLWRGEIGLAHGLVGIGVYLLERFPAHHSREGLERVFHHLAASAVIDGKGMSWTCHGFREDCLDGIKYDLGLRHGVPGVIYLLSEMFAAGIRRDESSKLLGAVVDWMLNQPAPTDSAGRFGPAVTSQGQALRSRLGWCQGDLGVAMVLLQAGRRLENAVWQSQAIAMLDQCLSWPDDNCEGGPFLCHGRVGCAHIFGRAYQMTGNERYRAAAGEWLQWIEFNHASIDNARLTEQTKRPATFLIDNLTGVALGLASALSPTEPEWDRAILMSGRTLSEKLLRTTGVV